MFKVVGLAMLGDVVSPRPRDGVASAPDRSDSAQPSPWLWLGIAIWLGFSATSLVLLHPTQLWLAICTSN